jgi:acyl-coenzyme A thioesterase PaaI-like protein
MAEDRVAFQDRMEEVHCFGCGPTNPEGLRLKTHWQGEESVSFFRAKPHLCAGPKSLLNGGIIATVLDCHGIGTAVADAYRREGREIGEGRVIAFATGRMTVGYLAPVPIDQEVEIRGRVVEAHEKKSRIECSLLAGGQECATADIVAVRVPAAWGAGS